MRPDGGRHKHGRQICDHRTPAAPLPQCHLKFFSLVLQTVARLQPELMQPRARPLWRLRPKLPRLGSAAAWRSLPHVAAVVDETLAHLTVMLRRNHTIPALVLSHHLALALGWDWTGEASHLAGLDADPPCWDQAATLATLLDDLVPANGEAGACSQWRAGLLGLARAWSGCSSQAWRRRAPPPPCRALQNPRLHGWSRSGVRERRCCRQRGIAC